MQDRGGTGLKVALRSMAAWLLCCASICAAGAPGVDAIRFRNYSTVDGLSQATVLTIAQDTTGFLWVGTQDGLNRFDGYEFKVYKHDRADPRSLADNYIQALLADSDGALWIGTQAGGLDRYDSTLDKFTRYAADPEREDALAADNVTALLRDHRGRLWVANDSGRLQWFDRVTQKFHDTPLGMRPPLRAVRGLLERADGSVLIGTHAGLWRCDGDATTMHELRGAQDQPLDVQALAAAKNGDVWVSTANAGLFRFSADDALLEHFAPGADAAHDFPDAVLRGIDFDRSGMLWIATKNAGLVRLDPASGGFVGFRHDPAQPHSIAANRQQSVFVDRDGLIWAGSWVNGVSMHDPRTEAFVDVGPVFGSANALPAHPVGTVYTDTDGTLWLGVLEGGGLVHFDLERGVIERYADAADASELPHNIIGSMIRTRDGSLWVATAGGGLHRRAQGAPHFEHMRHDSNNTESLASDELLFLMQDRAETLWIGTADAGLDELCAGCTKFRHHRHDPARADSIGADAVSGVLESRQGELWIALHPGGLDRYDRQHDRFEHFRANANDPASISHDTVSVLMEDSRGDLWIGTQGGGLNHLLPGAGAPRFEAISSADGLAADAIGSIVEDATNALWVSTTVGISKIEVKGKRVTNFGAREGAQGRGYFINASGRLADGRIVFGGLDGLTILDPALAKLPPSPQPLITELLLRNVPAKPHWRETDSPLESSPWSGRRAILNHEQDAVSFEFSAFGFSDPESINYSYLLEGHDQQWTQVGISRRIATYTDLPPGDYRLRVRARYDGQAWSSTEANLSLRVLSPPWASPLAYFFYTAAALLLALLVWLRMRTGWRKQAAAQEAIRSNEERLKYALWGSGGELWDIDLKSGNILRENRLEHLAASREATAQTLQGYRPYVHPDDLAHFEHDLAEHLKGHNDFHEVTYRSPDLQHEWRWLLSRGRVVERDAKGHALRMVGTTQDISTLKRTEESLRKLNEELESRVETRTSDLSMANAQLRYTLEQLTLAQRQLLEAEKMVALGGLVAGIAHEINTPLGVTVTAASHLQEEAGRIARSMANKTLTRDELDRFQNTARESAELILRNLQRADRLVKSFKQIAVDQTTEERRVIELGTYLNEILVSLHPVLKKKPQKLRIECQQPVTMNTYPGALYQIVSNLVMNSLSHGFDPEQVGDMVLRARRVDARVLLQYADNGKGMSDAVRAQIFEPFFTTKRGQGGSGLGMHIVYNLVTQVLKGSIRVESGPGVGVLFEISIPAEAGAHPTPPPEINPARIRARPESDPSG